MKIKSQCGFATIEILLAVAIIAIFSSVAIPNMARLLDKVCLDYEMKHLYSDLNFARAVGKSSDVTGGIPFGIDKSGGAETKFLLYSDAYSTKSFKNNYWIERPSMNAYYRYRHKIRHDIKLEFPNGKSALTITFNNPSRYSSATNSQTITLNSKFGYSAYIIFDSVGRWRGSYEK